MSRDYNRKNLSTDCHFASGAYSVPFLKQHYATMSHNLTGVSPASHSGFALKHLPRFLPNIFIYIPVPAMMMPLYL